MISTVFKRLQSTKSSHIGPLTIPRNSSFLISIPITTSKSFVFYNQEQPRSSPKQQENVSFIIKFENKVVNLASKGWSKLTNSKSKVNIKIVEFIKALLSTIPYEENYLRSFPSKSTIDLGPIPLFHPQFQKPETILNQLHLIEDKKKHYTQRAIGCAIGIPISLPFALVPVVPNIPGFYLGYRLYCNIKALIGIQHLEDLLKTKNIVFESVTKMDELYADNPVPEKESIIINEKIIDQLTRDLGLENLREDLLKALKQETKKLNRQKD
ncbi:SPAC23H3.12c Uncharacterized protein C23H3.12c [Candida maltosa Xu316]